jgi:hypothetical protein
MSRRVASAPAWSSGTLVPVLILVLVVPRCAAPRPTRAGAEAQAPTTRRGDHQHTAHQTAPERDAGAGPHTATRRLSDCSTGVESREFEGQAHEDDKPPANSLK